MNVRLKFGTVCDDCGGWMPAGTPVLFNGNLEAVHAGDCPDPLPKPSSREVSCHKCFLIHPVGECDR